MMTKHVTRSTSLLICLLTAMAGCSRSPEPVSEDRFHGPDELFRIIDANVRSHPDLEVIVDIDHARLGAEAGSPMPPAHVLIFSDPVLDAAILAHNPVAAVDLPMRVLAFEDPSTGEAAVIFNSFDFVAARHGVPADPTLRARYDAAIAAALEGVPETSVASFPTDEMEDPGLITLDSPFDFATTEQRVVAAIAAQADTVTFGAVDFAARSSAHGVQLEPMRLILFGGPGPGGRVMQSAPTLGLDAFCQKLLIWQDADGGVHVTFNDLLALADRQQVSGGVPLRVVNRRIQATFTEALEN